MGLTSATFEEHVAMDVFPRCYRKAKIQYLDINMAGCYDILAEWYDGGDIKIKYRCNDLEVFNELLRQQDMSLFKFMLTIQNPSDK